MVKIDPEPLKQAAQTIAIQWKAFVDEGCPEEVATEFCLRFIDNLFQVSSETSKVNEGILKMLQGAALHNKS